MKKFAIFVALVVVALVVLRARYESQQTEPPSVPRQPVPPDVTQPSAVHVPAPDVPAAPPVAVEPDPELIRPGVMELYPTYSAVGLEFTYDGDADTNATATMSWRHVGEDAWRDGVDVTIDRARHMMWASIWPLEQDQAIEVRLELMDPKPLPDPRISRTRTRRMLLTTSGGRTIFVSPVSGDDVNPGTKDAPFKTMAKATAGLKSGDTVYAMSGLYQEGLHLEYVKAVEGKPVVITAAPGHKPVMDGSIKIKPGAGWSEVETGLYSIKGDFPEEGIAYLAQNGERMYPYENLDGLKADEFNNGRCWFYDQAEKRIYIRTGDAQSPSAHTYNAARFPYGIWLEGCKYIVISGIEFQYYGNACIRFSGPATIGNVAFGNTVHNAPSGIFIKTEAAENCAVWNNLVYEPGLRDFSWHSIKSSPYSRQGITVWESGRGMSVCHNRIHEWFDGIDVESWMHPTDYGMNRDSDVMFNEIWNVGDDGMELDGGGINMRVHGNHIRNAHSAISLAPIERGPVYVTRNDATYHNLFFKMSVGSDSVGWTYGYHNSAYTMEDSNEATMIRFNDPGLKDEHRVFKNNAMIGSEFCAQRVRRGHVLDYNCYYGTTNVGPRKFVYEDQVMLMPEFQSFTGMEQHGLYADPKFTATPDLGKYPPSALPSYEDCSIGDMRPAPGSPLIDHGAVIRGINGDFKGAAPDIGAFEAGS